MGATVEQTNDAGFSTTADVDSWVQQHGRRRLLQLMLSGQLKGDALRTAKAWLAMQDDRRHLATIMLVVAFAMAVVVAGIAQIFVG